MPPFTMSSNPKKRSFKQSTAKEIPERLTVEWLKENVGEPSGARGSIYSDIVKLTQNYEKTVITGGNDKILGNTGTLNALRKLREKVTEWTWSKHPGATSDEQKARKKEQHYSLSKFMWKIRKNLEQLDAGMVKNIEADIEAKKEGKEHYPKETAQVKTVLTEMKNTGGIIGNTAEGILKENGWVVKELGGTAAEWKGNERIEINPRTLWDKLLLIGSLVHEYHHRLVGRNGHAYVDEFYAHWKEYLVTKGPAGDDRAREVNDRLKHNPPYKTQYYDYIKKYKKELQGPPAEPPAEGSGSLFWPFWYENNKKVDPNNNSNITP